MKKTNYIVLMEIKEENRQLTEKIEKLKIFIHHNESFKSLDQTHQNLLKSQYESMLSYSKCLEDRTELLEQTIENNK